MLVQAVLSRYKALLSSWSARTWTLAAFGLLLAIAYDPLGVDNAGTFRWSLAGLGAWCLASRPQITTRALPLMVFAAWLALSALWSPQPYDAMNGLFQLLVAIGMFALGASVDDPRPFYVGLGVGLPIAALLGGFNPDYKLAAEVAGLVAIALTAWGLWLIALIPAAVMLTSKGAALAVTVATIVGVSRWRRNAIVLVVGGIVAALFALHGFASSYERLRIWSDVIAGIVAQPGAGHGLGSVWQSFPAYADAQEVIAPNGRPDHIHNDWLEIAFEQGVIGLILFAVSMFTLLVRQYRTPEGLVLIGVLALCMVAFPLHVPLTLAVAAFACGRLCRDPLPYRLADLRRVLAKQRTSRGTADDGGDGGHPASGSAYS